MNDGIIDRSRNKVSHMVWLPVRCCCTPHKIFGFLKISEDDARRHSVEVDGNRVQLKRFSDAQARIFDSRPTDPVNWMTELVVYSDDRPREFWRSLPGFIEVVATD